MLTLLHSVRPKLYTIFAFLSAIGLKRKWVHFQSGKSETTLPFSFHNIPVFSVGLTLKGKNLLLLEQNVSFKSRSQLRRVSLCKEPNRKL